MSTNPFDQFDSVEENPIEKNPIEENSIEKNPFDQFDQFDDTTSVSTPAPDSPDFIPGVQRGLQNLQAMTYGAGALAGEGLRKLGAENIGQKLKDVGIEGYQRNIEEAKQFPKKHSFKDVYTGEAGVGGAIDWAQRTLGELVPSMVEAATGAVIGATVGSSVPGAGTIGGGVIGGFMGRTVLKKAIDTGMKQAMKKGIGNATEAQVRAQVTKQAMKKLGGKVGLGAATMPINSGGMYAELLEEKGIDAPETALFFGALQTSMEFFGGNSKLIDTFVDALGSGSKGLAKKTAKELMTNIPQEAMQEGGQEALGILNKVVNTDEEFFTAENMEQIIEGMGAGAIGGGAGAVVSSTISAQSDGAPDQLTERFENIKSQGADKIPASIGALDQEVIQNNKILQDVPTLNKLAEEAGISSEDLTAHINRSNEANQELKTRLQEELANPTEVPAAPAEQVDTDTLLANQRDQQAAEEVAKNKQIQGLDERIDAAREIYLQLDGSPRQKAIGQRLTALVNEKKVLVEGAPAQTFEATPQTTPEEKQVDNELLTQSGTPYKNKTVLERLIAERAYPENYTVVEVDGGFIGVKKTDTTSEMRAEDQLAADETSTFKSEPPLEQRKPVVEPTQVEQDLQVNEQQLDALIVEMNAETDPDAKMALQQEGTALYEQNTLLKDQLAKQVREDVTAPEAGAEFQTSESAKPTKVSLENISGMFPKQDVIQADDGSVVVKFKNGKGVTFRSIQDAGQGFIKMAIETGQMSKNGKILGVTVGNEVLLDANFADNKTMWHENKHVLDNLGMITEADDSMLNKEFNRLNKAGKLNFAISTHESPIQRMVENRANMFAQIMVDRAAYRGKPLGKTIQKIMDFFQKMLALGQQSVAGLSQEVESGKIYERKVAGKTIQTTVPQAETTAKKWYSQLENTVNGFQQKQATPDQWKGMIKNFPGIKQEELEWLGVNDWLDKQEGKVTQKDLLNFVQENNIQLEEIVKEGDELAGVNKLLEPYGYTYEYSMDADQAALFDRDGEFVDDDSSLPPEVEAIITRTSDGNNTTKYSEYQIPGGKNYKEILLTSPSEGDQYQSVHWDEPNILAHIRFNERTDSEGNKVLFLEEIQSDWHQSGRKQGYAKDKITTKERDELISRLWKANSDVERYSAQVTSIRADNQATTGQLSDAILRRDIAIRESETLTSLHDAGRAISSKVPNAPFKKSWPLLAMKRMVRYAAENSFDKIAWTTGQQQADRYGKDNITEGGMAGFYDKMLPSMLNKEFNRGKWGKAKVEVIDSNVQEDVKVSKEEALEAFDAGKMIFLGQELIHPDGLERHLIEEYQGTDITTDRPIKNLSLPITDRMKSKALREGMPMFETREQTDQPVQKISDAQYDKSFNQKNNIVQNIAQTLKIRGKDFALLADKALGSVSTRLGNANPLLKAKLREVDFNTSQKIIEALHIAKPLLDKTKEMTPADKHAWDLARKNSDEGKIQKIAQQYGMLEDQEKLRTTMDKLRKDAIDVGYDVGFVDEYWPRIIKDQEGFLQATQGISEDPVFSNAIKKKAKDMGITVEQFGREFPEMKADIISNLVLGRGLGIGGPGNIQGRVYETIPDHLEKFYMNSDAALMQYIYSMTKKIEARKFFGKVPPKIAKHKTAKAKAQSELEKIKALAQQPQENAEVTQVFADRMTELQDNITLHDEALNKYKSQRDYTENIGAYIDRLMISGELHKKDERVVRDILEARFNEHGTTGVVNTYKNLAYIDVMGNPISALTQIGDLAWAAYVGKAWTPKGFSNTVKNAINATLGKSKVTKEDLGLERIAQEFADGTTLGNAVSSVFKMVGLTKMDSIGKETLINNALMNYQDQAKTDVGRKALEKKIRYIFGNKTKQVVQDIAAGNNTDNVKLLLYSKLLDFQPAALSEMPEMYLRGGNGRVFYMLKTYTLKQMDVFRTEVFHDIQSKDPKKIVKGIGNMIKLLSVLTIANAGADELKDFVLGKETKFSDNLIENFLTIGGASRFMQMQVTQEGLGSALTQKILPPTKFINAASQDARERIVTGDVADGGRLLESIPGVGKLAYWHFGRGDENKKSVEEQDFKKAGKQHRKFKKQFEKATDRRLFLQTNASDFKQMKLHENFQSKLNENKANTNKLEELEQTPAVTKRLGQLAEHRRVILARYFEVAETLRLQ